MITIITTKGLDENELIQTVTSYATPSDPKMMGATRKKARRSFEAEYEEKRKALLTVTHAQPSE